MADVTIKYKGSTIAELAEKGSTTLTTAGTYCEDNIEVSYAPRTKTYDITLAKASGWVLLTTLDDEVLEHINDASLVVSFARISEYVYEWYAGSIYIVTNILWGYSGAYPAYGLASRLASETASQTSQIYYPANNTDTTSGIGGSGQFRITSGNYYFRPSDGFIAPGTYRLTFTW